MTDGGGHTTHLTVFAFNQFQANPTIGHAFAETDGWIAWGNLNLPWWGERPPRAGLSAETLRRRLVSSLLPPNHRLRLQNPSPARQGFPALNGTRRIPASSMPPASGGVPPAPNIRVRGRDADAAGARSIPVRRSRSTILPNPHPAGQRGKCFSENRIRPALRFAAPSLVNCETDTEWLVEGNQHGRG